MIKITVDGVVAEVPEKLSVFEACAAAGRPFPEIFARADGELAGVIRLCSVEIRGREGLCAAATEKAVDGMEILTDSPRLKKARTRAVRLMLARHPADCGVCEKSGECLLQDICFELGMTAGETEKTPPLPQEDAGPLVKMHPDRCILCMKCLRFMRNVAGTPELILEGRGAQTRIKAFVNGAFSSPLSGNLIDLCPAGALVNGRLKTLIRPWNVKRVETIDVSDPFLPEIYADASEGRIEAVHPKPVAGKASGWISDRTRFGFEGTATGRIDRPYIRVDGRFKECSWTEALMTAASRIKSADPSRTAALAGSSADCESMAALRDMMKTAGSNNIDAGSFYARTPKSAGKARFCNTPLTDVEKADVVLIIGADPEREAPLLNAEIRRSPARKALIGDRVDLHYAYEYLGASSATLLALAQGKHPFAAALKQARFPMLVIGQSVWRRADISGVFAVLNDLCAAFGVVKDGWNGFNSTGVSTGMLNAAELGLVAQTPLLSRVENGAFDVLYLLGEDRLTRPNAGFVIYQGMYASETALAADVILPGLAYTEKRATYVSCTGKAKSTAPVLPPPGSAREDWKILRALSEYLEKTLPYDDLEGLRDRLGATSAVFVGRSERETPAGPLFENAAGELSEEAFASSGFYEESEMCRRSASLRAMEKIRGGAL